MKPNQQSLTSSPPLPRQEVEQMHAYTAPLEGRRDFLRLDFNENTIGPSPSVIAALKAIPDSHLSIYPEYDGLREAVVDHCSSDMCTVSLKPSQVGLFNGVDAAIHATFHAYGDRGNRLLTTTPTFGYYTPCAAMQGMDIIAIPYEGETFEFPLKKIRTALTEHKPKLLLICNPNNPTGTILNAETILQLAVEAPETLIVVDELYEAFCGSSLLPLVDFDSIPNILLLRSLSKTAGLASLRIGFAIGNADVIEKISRVTGPYDINSFAVTAAFAALKDKAFIDSYVAEVLHARDWINKQLISSGTRYHLGGGNYFLIWPKRKPDEIEAALKEEGILVRNMTGKALIDNSLRVSIGTITQMKTFWAAFSKHEHLEK